MKLGVPPIITMSWSLDLFYNIGVPPNLERVLQTKKGVGKHCLKSWQMLIVSFWQPFCSLAWLQYILPDTVTGHGRMRLPASRASMWRDGHPTPPDYNDNEGFCGGYNVIIRFILQIFWLLETTFCAFLQHLKNVETRNTNLVGNSSNLTFASVKFLVPMVSEWWKVRNLWRCLRCEPETSRSTRRSLG